MAPAGIRKPRMSAGKRKRRSDNHTFLPEDLMIEIMVRLPVKSLLRFKTVCKFYNNLIGSKDFIQNHDEHHSNDHPRLLVHHDDKILNHKDRLGFSNLLDETLDNLDYPPEFPFSLRKVIGCPVNGLFLLQGGTIINDVHPGMNRATIFNPFTRQFKEIKAPICNRTIQRGRRRGCPCQINFGFGFDSATDDFKVIAFPEPEHARGLFFHVYSLANDSWTSIIDHDINDPDESKLLHTYGSTYFNGTFHWLFADTDPDDDVHFSLLSFDMSSQTFDVFDGPKNPTAKRPFFFSRQYNTNDYLLSMLFYWPCSNYGMDVPGRSTDLMVMKSKGHWEKHLSIDVGLEAESMDILGLWKDNRVLFETDTKKARFYDTDTNEIQELGRFDNSAGIVQIFYYKGSLVSVKRSEVLTSEKPLQR